MNSSQQVPQMEHSLWLNSLNRSLIQSGELRSLIKDGVAGVKASTAGFKKGITEHGEDYDHRLRWLLLCGEKDPQDIYDDLIIQDIQTAADLLRPVYDNTGRRDGYVSLEINPQQFSAVHSIALEIQRLSDMIRCPNIIYQIPATTTGIDTLEYCIGRGINADATLIFSKGQYEQIAYAYISGLEQLLETNGDLSQVASTASIFVNRLDERIASRCDKDRPGNFYRKVGIVSAKVLYARFREIFSSEHWKQLADAGARAQRPLWITTATRKSGKSEKFCSEELIAANTIRALPQHMLPAFLSQKKFVIKTEDTYEQAADCLNPPEGPDVDVEKLAEENQQEVIQQLTQTYDGSIQLIKNQILEEIAVWSKIGVDNPSLLPQNWRYKKWRNISSHMTG